MTFLIIGGLFKRPAELRQTKFYEIPSRFKSKNNCKYRLLVYLFFFFIFDKKYVFILMVISLQFVITTGTYIFSHSRKLSRDDLSIVRRSAFLAIYDRIKER